MVESVRRLDQVGDGDRQLRLRFCEYSSSRFAEFRTLSIVAFRKPDYFWRGRGASKGDLNEFEPNDEREKGRERRRWLPVER